LETLEQKIKITFIKNGLWLGLILVGLAIASFYVIVTIAKSPILFVMLPLVFSFVLPVVAVLFFCFSGRKKIGGYWNFRQATTGIFIMFLIAYAIQTIGRDFIFAKLIEPNMVEKTQTAFMGTMTILKKQPGADIKRLNEKEAEVVQNFKEEKDKTIASVITTIFFSIIFIFVFALIFAALFKRERPVYV
jgi:hypothetical protein